MAPNESESDHIRNAFQNALFEHGYGFEAAVAFKLTQLATNRRVPWSVVTGEFPVTVRGQSTRIDILIERRNGHELGVCECKRANPALDRWCFVRLPHVGADRHDNAVHIDVVMRRAGSELISGHVVRGHVPNFAHIGLPIRSDNRGDHQGSTRDVIESALSQVARGSSGLIQFLRGNDYLLPLDVGVPIHQVIFTTATLWLSEANLNLADVRTGNVDLAPSNFQEVDWLVYQYPQSPSLRPEVSHAHDAKSLLAARNDLYYRSVFVVTAAGIENFLNAAVMNH
jgi:hypothetical protein